MKNILGFKKSKRLTDSNFVIRHSESIYYVALAFVIAFAFVYFIISLLKEYDNIYIILSLSIAFIFTAMAWFTIYKVQKSHDRMYITEFSSAIFSSVARLHTDFFVILNVFGEIEYASPETQALFEKSELTLDAILELGGLDKKDDILRSLENGTPVKLAYKHNEEKLSLTIDPIERPKGFFALKVASEIEVEEKKEKQSFPVLIQHSPIAIGLIDGDGKVIISNEPLRKFLLKEEDEEWNLMDIIDEKQKDIVYALLNSQQESEWIDVALNYDYYRGAALLIHPIETAADPKIKYAFYLMDNSKQKSIETKIANSQKMQAIGQLAGGIAHDFNNLLTAMIGFCDLLLSRHAPGDSSFSDIIQIKQNATRASGLVRQLLAFSRRQVLQAKIISITSVLSELSNLIRRLIGENIRLEMIHGENLKMVKVDEGQLEQVILNLAVNARDAMLEKGGDVTIETSNVVVSKKTKLDFGYTAEEETIPEGEYVKISVSDTGTGIPDDVIEKIFEPFFSTKGNSGTGLGLATVYGIVKQTKGYIFVNSEEGKGTTFNILFKGYDAPEKEEVAEEKTVIKDLTGGNTILLVEDEIAVKMVAYRALSNKGYNVLEAESAEEALEIVEKEGDKIELIITDVMMSGMTGPAMVKKIQEKHADIKVVFISGYAKDAFAENFDADEDFNFLPKPFTLKKLAETVKDVLS